MVSLLFFLSNSGDFKNLLSVFCYLRKLCISHPRIKPGAGSDLAKYKNTARVLRFSSFFNHLCNRKLAALPSVAGISAYCRDSLIDPQASNYAIKTMSLTRTSSNNSITSSFIIRIQPADTASPILFSSEVPWIYIYREKVS